MQAMKNGVILLHVGFGVRWRQRRPRGPSPPHAARRCTPNGWAAPWRLARADGASGWPPGCRTAAHMSPRSRAQPHAWPTSLQHRLLTSAGAKPALRASSSSLCLRLSSALNILRPCALAMVPRCLEVRRDETGGEEIQRGVPAWRTWPGKQEGILALDSQSPSTVASL